MTIKQDLPALESALKTYALEGLARAGLTYADCVAFFAKHRSSEELDYVVAAKDMYHVDGELEVDDNAPVSMGEDPGAYVAVWVWIPKESDDV